MSRPWSPDEPARQPDYQRFYRRVSRSMEELDAAVSAMYKIVNDLRDRVRALEERERR